MTKRQAEGDLEDLQQQVREDNLAPNNHTEEQGGDSAEQIRARKIVRVKRYNQKSGALLEEASSGTFTLSSSLSTASAKPVVEAKEDPEVEA
jgi:hypothetical protein